MVNILMLSWEYPPLSYGGLARHVQDLSEKLVKRGHTVYIITQGDNNIPLWEEKAGVKIFRSRGVEVGTEDFIKKILHLNFQLLERALEIKNLSKNFDIIHAHDWLVFWAAKVLKHSIKKPLIYTIHATEYGRNRGLHNNMQRYINDLEWYSCFEAWRVIVCSNYMRNEVRGLFQIPEDKIEVIKNGVTAENYKDEAPEKFRSQFVHPEEKMIFYVGRLVREKGVQILLQAMPEILSHNEQVKLVVSGRGPYRQNLMSLAHSLGIAERVYFTGFISDKDRNYLYDAADIAVFPSLYEPFGIVALEAMAAKAPLITTSAGGLDEFVHNGHNGIKVEPGNPGQLAGAVIELLDDENKAKKMAERAQREVKRKFNWSRIAGLTERVYSRVRDEYRGKEWHKIEQEAAGERREIFK